MRILGVRNRRDICRATAALLLFTASAAGQIPDKFENLQVLPKTISKKDLVATMVNISLATGLRCENCHVGEGGPELKNMTYPADDKETKRTARIMLRMVQAINQDYITNLGRESPIKVECATCHHGVSRPQTLQALLADTIDRKGLSAAVAQYRDLRKDYYGSGAYDFRDVSLNQLGEALLVKDKAKDAAAILELNVEFNPQSSGAHYRLAEAYRSVGELEMARKNYEKTLELDPHYDRAKARLDELRKGPKAGTVPR